MALPVRHAFAGAMVTALTLAIAVGGCSSLSEAVNPCPESSAPLVCPNQVCCPSGYPYECNNQCYTAARACGSSYVTCAPFGSGGTTVPSVASVGQSSGSIGAVMLNPAGEMLFPGVTRDGSGNPTSVTGAVYSSMAGGSYAVFFDSQSRPGLAVLGDVVLVFANWNASATTADIGELYTDTGYIRIFRQVSLDAHALSSASLPASSGGLQLEYTCLPNCGSPEQTIAEELKIAGLLVEAGTCAAEAATGLEALAIPCAGTLLGAASLATGNEAWMGQTEQAALVTAAIGCTENAVGCIAYLAEMGGNLLSTLTAMSQSSGVATVTGDLANSSIGSGIAAEGGGPPSCGTSYECNPGAYMPCYPDGTKQCSPQCTWSACPTSSAAGGGGGGGCATQPDCPKGTHQVNCGCVSDSGGGGGSGGGTCPDGSACDSTGGHVCCQCSSGSYQCLLQGLCNLGC